MLKELKVSKIFNAYSERQGSGDESSDALAFAVAIVALELGRDATAAVKANLNALTGF